MTSQAPDLTKSVRVRAGTIQVFCVECDVWHSIEVSGRVNITARLTEHTRVNIDDLNEDDLSYCCCVCKADTGYLLTAEHRQGIVKQLLNA